LGDVVQEDFQIWGRMDWRG